MEAVDVVDGELGSLDLLCCPPGSEGVGEGSEDMDLEEKEDEVEDGELVEVVEEGEVVETRVGREKKTEVEVEVEVEEGRRKRK